MSQVAGEVDPSLDPDAVHAFGAFHLALMAGLTLQWMVDPERAPTADQMISGLRTMARLVSASE